MVGLLVGLMVRLSISSWIGCGLFIVRNNLSASLLSLSVQHTSPSMSAAPGPDAAAGGGADGGGPCGGWEWIPRGLHRRPSVTIGSGCGVRCGGHICLVVEGCYVGVPCGPPPTSGPCIIRRPISAATAVDELSSTLPGFADHGLFDGHELHFGRKAQSLVAALRARFALKDPRFAFEGMEKLTADTGTVLYGFHLTRHGWLRSKFQGVVSSIRTLAKFSDHPSLLDRGKI